MFTVVITEKEGNERRLSFAEPEVTIGRVPGNDVVLPKGNVSKRHSRIVLKDNRFIVVDLKSTNGTYVNGRKITSPLVVKEGDKIYVGDFILTLEGDSAAAPASSMKPPSLMPDLADSDDASSRPPSGPPPLPSRAPDPITDDLPAVLRATMSSLPPVITSSAPPEVSEVEESTPAPAPRAERNPLEQTNVNSNGSSAESGRASVPAVLAMYSSHPPTASVAPVRTLHARHDDPDLGPLEVLLEDASVSHLLVERFDRIYVDRGNGLVAIGGGFGSPEALLETIQKLCHEAGIDAPTQPSYDVSLPSGLHMVCVLPSAATDGPLLALRRRPARVPTLAELEKAGLLSASHEKALNQALHQRRSLWLVGPPGADLAGVLGALVGALPRGERIALFERAPEVALNGRPAVGLKLGADALSSLFERVRHFRADRLVMHELREAELKDALLAFAQRHDGSIGSVEHRSAQDALAAFDRSVGPDVVLRAAALIAEASRSENGKTRVSAVHQVELDASGELTLKPL
jgi:pilus assembly protein CpaF